MTFQPGQSGNPAGRPRGSRNACAWITLRRRCGAAPRCEGGMLLHAVWMKAVNPEKLDTRHHSRCHQPHRSWGAA